MIVLHRPYTVCNCVFLKIFILHLDESNSNLNLTSISIFRPCSDQISSSVQISGPDHFQTRFLVQTILRPDLWSRPFSDRSHLHSRSKIAWLLPDQAQSDLVFAYGIIVNQEVKKSCYNHTDTFTEVAVDTEPSVVVRVKCISTFVDWANLSLVPNIGDPGAKNSVKQF